MDTAISNKKIDSTPVYVPNKAILMSDLKDTIKQIDLVELIDRDIGLKKNGKEYVALCPFHDEKTASFSVSPSKQIYKCFGCGASGDALEWIVKYRGKEKIEAIKEIKKMAGMEVVQEAGPVWPAPEQPPKLKAGQKLWEYRTEKGELMFYVVRQELPDGKKRFSPYTWDGKKWQWKGAPDSKPLYGLETLKPGPVIIAEGEKAADAGRKLYKWPVLAWLGGTNAAFKVNVMPIKGREVTLICDNDEPGKKAMHRLSERLNDVGCKVYIINPGPDFPKGWDVADPFPEGWSHKKLFLRRKEVMDNLSVELEEAEIKADQKYEKAPIMLEFYRIHTNMVRTRVMSAGNISAIKGLAGAKKTALTTLIVSSLLSKGKSYGIMESYTTGNVCVFDTEQSEYDVWRNVKRVEEICGSTINLKAYCLRQYSHIKRRELIAKAIEIHRPRVAVIDGVADLVSNINDEVQATEVQELLLSLTKNHNMHIMNIIHQNKGDRYATGHVGSMIMKKAEMVIEVEGDGENSTVKCWKVRGSVPFQDFEIGFNGELPVVIGGEINTETDKYPDPDSNTSNYVPF